MPAHPKPQKQIKERKPWGRRTYTPAPSVPGRLTRPVVYGTCTGVAMPKENVATSPAYENAVRDLGYCMRCGRICRPQFCHRDEGKGGMLKTDVREGWAGCGPGPWGPGCHYIVGTSGTLTKEQRRAEDLRLGGLTRAAVRNAGTWPKRLPVWPEDIEKGLI